MIDWTASSQCCGTTRTVYDRGEARCTIHGRTGTLDEGDGGFRIVGFESVSQRPAAVVPLALGEALSCAARLSRKLRHPAGTA